MTDTDRPGLTPTDTDRFDSPRLIGGSTAPLRMNANANPGGSWAVLLAPVAMRMASALCRFFCVWVLGIMLCS
ncbi:hypothetical protein ASPVEDRAFT_35539 [Aspergillus versicolor CBS 583.65]|uniref:Uncharacterized protein n=1 Tax=Aspergillus versicolor CBS 583.65 TaxID=1036611 RepID=A0A1L9P3R3_ASPVE|nr:uncharacterized protein ASPVEDRAFT_35539 [Aspergillus versicolor CBS 583.65]OJI96177.1 hypothetical protein ASPVEDRAFT_35539 [Aspergillus versicolor CBS 583.65]